MEGDALGRRSDGNVPGAIAVEEEQGDPRRHQHRRGPVGDVGEQRKRLRVVVLYK